jgi:nucleoside-diphosphate-sugar epimerase
MAQLVGTLETICGRKTLPLPIPAPLFKFIAFVSETAFRLVRAVPMLTVEKSRELLASWSVSTDKAKRELGFESSIPFDRGARETFEWYLKEGWL